MMLPLLQLDSRSRRPRDRGVCGVGGKARKYFERNAPNKVAAAAESRPFLTYALSPASCGGVATKGNAVAVVGAVKFQF